MTKVTERLTALGSTEDIVQAANVKRILHNNYVNGNEDKAVELLTFFQGAVEGLLLPITHPLKSSSLGLGSMMTYNRIAGADNLNGVTCYLDTLMFAMFARLENFEPILYKTFESDEKRENLAIILRLYVNLLRSGKLITTDVTKCLLDAIFNAGWAPSSKRNEQQDAAELFNFISEKLKMPLLTLRVDIAHAGKEVAEDDHKLVNERLLLVPIPGERTDPPVLLEECLEKYFANSVQVSRQLERRLVNDSILDHDSKPRTVRKFSLETVEIPKLLDTIEEQKPLIKTGESGRINGNENKNPDEKSDSPDPVINMLRSRASTSHSLPSYESLYKDKPPPTLPPQKMVALWNTKNEITLPAWMFLQLLPFYSDIRTKEQKKHDNKVLKKQIMKNTDDEDSSSSEEDEGDAPVEEHFANARPVLGICLKRYSWTADHQSVRNDRQVLVPQTIHLPSFVADDTDEGSLFGNFKLVLESAVFHRGNSINSGHFVAITAEDAGIDYDEVDEVEGVNNAGSSFFGTKRRRQHRRRNTHNDRDELRPPKSPYSQPVSARNSDSGPRPRRWVFFDDLQPPGQKTSIVDFDEVFAKECPYLLFYRMVSAADDDSLSSISRSNIPPIPSLSSLSLANSISIESDTVNSLADTIVNIPGMLSQSTVATYPSDTTFTHVHRDKENDRGRDRKADRDRKGGKLFRLSRGKAIHGSPSRSQSAPPEKRISTTIPRTSGLPPMQQDFNASISTFGDSGVYLGAPSTNPAILSTSPDSRMGTRTLRRKASENSYNVDEKCVLM